jgi:phage terminase large subunit GpA-like protein
LWTAKKQPPDEWGAEHRVYGPETGKPGQRDPWIAPYNIALGRSFGDARYRRIVQVEGAQMGKTETFLDIIGERLDNRPAPILYVGPSKEFLTDQFEPRLVDLFRQSASLERKVLGGIDGKRQKRTLKRVAGVRVRLAHAGSSTALKSDPAAFALVDEYDEMVANVKGQGDPLGLIEARGDTYADFTVAVTSTPSRGLVEIERDPLSGLEFWKVDEDAEIGSPIWKLWQEGTRYHWCWPCPHCGEYFVPRFKLLRWPKNAAPAQAKRGAYLQCPRDGCGGVIEEKHKADMNARGRYVAPGQTVDRDGNVTGEPPDTGTLSRWCSGLASPFKTFGERAEAYLTAFRSGEAAKIQTAINAGFGEVFTDDGGDLPAWEVIKNRAEPYRPGSVPAEAIFLTFAGDVQKNRIVYVVRGWGARATSWLIENGELWGETSHPDVWDDLAQKLTTPIDGLLIKLAFIDSGFRPGKKIEVPVNRVYEFCRRFRSFVFPTKGASVALVTPLVKRKIEVTQQGTQAKYGLDLIRLDPNYWKSWVHERLDWAPDQPGAFHLHEEISEDYCRQLVAEAMVRGPSGKPVWIERARENHYLDAEAMCAAAGFMLNAQHLKIGARRGPALKTEAAGPVQPKPNDRFTKIANELNG